MNSVFIWGAPVVDEEKYVDLTKKIIALFKNNLQQDVVVFFPGDLMKWDLGKEMMVYASCTNLPTNLRQSLAGAIGLLVKEAFKPERISCSVLDEPEEGEGRWSF